MNTVQGSIRLMNIHMQSMFANDNLYNNDLWWEQQLMACHNLWNARIVCLSLSALIHSHAMAIRTEQSLDFQIAISVTSLPEIMVGRKSILLQATN